MAFIIWIWSLSFTYIVENQLSSSFSATGGEPFWEMLVSWQKYLHSISKVCSLYSVNRGKYGYFDWLTPHILWIGTVFVMLMDDLLQSISISSFGPLNSFGYHWLWYPSSSRFYDITWFHYFMRLWTFMDCRFQKMVVVGYCSTFHPLVKQFYILDAFLISLWNHWGKSLVVWFHQYSWWHPVLSLMWLWMFSISQLWLYQGPQAKMKFRQRQRCYWWDRWPRN